MCQVTEKSGRRKDEKSKIAAKRQVSTMRIMHR
jgi:hypothetical protein